MPKVMPKFFKAIGRVSSAVALCAWLPIVVAAMIAGCGPSQNSLSAANQPATPVAATTAVSLTVLHTNDFQSRFFPITATRANFTYGGIARLAGAVDKLRREAVAANERLIYVDAGDFFGDNILTTATEGRATIRLANRLAPDAATLGRAEFAVGDAHLVKLLRGELDNEAANFPIICANVTVPNAPWQPYVIKNLNGLRVGLIGLAAPDLKAGDEAENLGQTELRDLADAMRAAVTALKDRTDIIIVLSQCGVDADKVWAADFAGDVDLIVAGGGENTLPHGDLTGPVPIVSAGRYGRWLGRVVLQVDRATGTVSVDGDAELIDLRAEPAFAGESPEMIRALSAEDRAVQVKLKRVIAEVEAEMLHDTRLEAPLAIWEAAAMLAAVPEADVAIMNWGGVREKWAAGPLTVGDVYRANPFRNRLVTVKLTGDELLRGVALNIGTRPLQLAGATVDYCRQFERGWRALTMHVDGQEIDPNREYTIVTNNYVAEHMSSYFGIPEAKPISETGKLDAEVFIAEAEKQKKISPPAEGSVYRYQEAPNSPDEMAGPAGFVVGTFPLGRIIDGDTITVIGYPRSLRILGIDTEENFKNANGLSADEWREMATKDFADYYRTCKGDSPKPVKCFTPMGDAAKVYAEQLLRGVRYVRLEYDDLGRQIDMYDRLLVHVFYQKPTDGPNSPWRNLALEMVEAGYSPYFNKYGNLRRFHAEFVAAQEAAQAGKRNIWSEPGADVPHFYPDYPERLEWWDRRQKALADYENHRTENDDTVPLQVNGGRDFAKMETAVGKTVELLLHARDVARDAPAIECVFIDDAHPFEIRFASAEQMRDWWADHFLGEQLRVKGTLIHDSRGWAVRPATKNAIALYE